MTDHAISNSQGWMRNIIELLVAYDAATDATAREEAERAIHEAPLSVQVRDGWHAPGARSSGPDEYEILLSTGGPACRIYGRLTDYCAPGDLPSLQYQDWGTPWTDAPCDREALQRFASFFYFGE